MATFDVQITAGQAPSNCWITATGQEIHTITDTESKAFGFDDYDRIRRACGSIIGESPDEWFLHNPTKPHPNSGDHRYDNAYDVFGWQPVTVTLCPIKSEWLGVDTDPVIAYHVEWDNELDHPATYSADMSVTKTESVSHTISSNTSIGVGTTISFGIGIEGIGDVSREGSFTFTKEWGDSTTDTQDIMVGASAQAYDDVPAYSSETAYLWSNLGSARFRVTYQASLSGWLMTINNDWYGGHGYRGLDPGSVLGKAGLPSVVTVQYDHTVGFYSGARVDLAPGPYDPNHTPPYGSLAHAMVFAPKDTPRPGGDTEDTAGGTSA
ncbi:hypothetical protein ABZ626_24395 [Streptomyces longispororuber]|uniref:hypothetical protein n=1 Tax=Streptomyces longispororuber TaxID=68230 RepID=UPI0033DBD7C1